MSANGFLRDAMTRHQIFLQRFGGGLARQNLPAIRLMQRQIRELLQRTDLTDFQTARLAVLAQDVNQIITANALNIRKVSVPVLEEFAASEVAFNERLLGGAVKVSLSGITPEALLPNVLTAPLTLISGKTSVVTSIDGIFNVFAEGAAREIMTSVQAGLISGRTNRQIVNDISSMIGTRTKAQAETVVRTAANHVASLARDSLYQQNADVLDGEIWSATLDSQTRLEHAALDGQEFEVGRGPMTPLGYNCRCVRVPKVKAVFAFLREGATRAASTGPEPSTATFGGWLGRQPASFQDEFLGPQRAKLFREGGLSIGKFVDQRNVRYTLDDLRRLEPLAFERAGL